MKKPRINQLTDDDINEFVYDLSEYLEKNNIVPADFFADDTNWENFREYIQNELEPFSNGYVNYN